MFASILFAVTAMIAPLPKPDATFTTGALHVQQFGHGAKNLIFIPGLGSGPWSWSEQIAHFSKDYTVYALTLTGFDGTAYEPASDLFSKFQDDFWYMLDSKKISKPVVIGHSLGGTLAFALAEKHPDKLAGAIALDGLPVFPTAAMATEKQRIASAEQLEAQIDAQTSAQFADSQVSYMKNVGVLNSDLVEPAAKLEATSDPKAVGAWMAQDLRHDLRPGLPKMDVPFLEILPYAPSNAYTKEQTVGFYRALVSGAPNIDVAVIDNARHFAMLDQPQAVDDAITRFLATLK